MHRIFPLVILVFALSSAAQVTLVSPEEGRRALQNAPPVKAGTAALAPSAAAPKSNRSTILPDSFAGWTAGAPQLFGPYNAGSLSSEDAATLVEYGYTGAERRGFSRNAQSFQADAVRMKDVSGSYGLYTFYRSEDWELSEAGDAQIASRGSEALIRKGDVLVRVSGASLTRADLQALMAETAAKAGPLPPVPQFLPEEGMVRGTRRYVLGPAAYARVAASFPAALVDFNLGAEAAVARYRTHGSETSLLLVSYPTPQIAAAKLKSYEQGPQPAGAIASTMYGRRRGALLSFVAGAPNQTIADALFDRIRYSAQLTWNEAAPKRQPSISGFLIGLFKFTGLLVLFAIAAGICFAMLKLLAQVWFPHQIFERPEETEFIQLNINYGR